MSRTAPRTPGTDPLPRRTPGSRRAPELRCDFCTWPAAYIAPESGAVVCDPYTHPLDNPGAAHPIGPGQNAPDDDPADLAALLTAAGL